MSILIKTLTAAAATLMLAGSAFAQSTLNIGPAPTPGGPPPAPQNQCLAITLAGSTFVRICNNGYTAQLGGVSCGGYASMGGGFYSLSAGGCSNGQQFLGGTLQCNGPACTWTPSAAGFAAGFKPETVYAQYQ